MVDEGGAVFIAAPTRGILAPVYTFGPKDDVSPVFTCPVSAIPLAAWKLLEIWYVCQALKLPAAPGTALDQPLSIRRSFPVFEAEYARQTRRRQQSVGVDAAAAVLGAMFAARK